MGLLWADMQRASLLRASHVSLKYLALHHILEYSLA